MGVGGHNVRCNLWAPALASLGADEASAPTQTQTALIPAFLHLPTRRCRNGSAIPCAESASGPAERRSGRPRDDRVPENLYRGIGTWGSEAARRVRPRVRTCLRGWAR